LIQIWWQQSMPLTCHVPEIPSRALSWMNLAAMIGGSDTSWGHVNPSKFKFT
jgi:hypothetical protein